MTAARLVARKEVERVYASLEQAFVAELPEHAEMVRVDLVIVPAPPRNTRAFVLWEALRLAWSARARFLRRDTTAHAKKRGQRMPLHDDKLRDQAIRSMERAIAQATNAARFLEEDAVAMEGIAKKLRGGRVEGPREDHVHGVAANAGVVPWSDTDAQFARTANATGPRPLSLKSASETVILARMRRRSPNGGEP